MSKTIVKGSLVGNMGFSMDLDGHRLITDGAPEIGGENLGPRPKQLMLSALIGCTGIDVMSILKKMKVDLDGFDIEVSADNTEDHPKVYENIFIKYVFIGKNLEDHRDKIEKAVSLSKNKYCGVSAMLEKASEINYEVIIKS